MHTDTSFASAKQRASLVGAISVLAVAYRLVEYLLPVQGSYVSSVVSPAHVAYAPDATDQDRQPKEREVNQCDANEVRKRFYASASGFDERRKHAVKVKDQHKRYEKSAHHRTAMLMVRSSNYPADKQIQPATDQKMGESSPTAPPKVANIH